MKQGKQKWEYHTEILFAETVVSEIDALLKRLGLDCWELAGIMASSDPPSFQLAIFKRPRANVRLVSIIEENLDQKEAHGE